MKEESKPEVDVSKSKTSNKSCSLSPSCQLVRSRTEYVPWHRPKKPTTEFMGRICKTCNKSIPSGEETYMCVSFNCHRHLTSECTALSTAAISGIKKWRVNRMLLCNKCVEKIEGDNFIRGRALASISEKLSTLDVVDKLKNMEKRLTDPVGQKGGEAMKTACEKLEKHTLSLSPWRSSQRQVTAMPHRKLTKKKLVTTAKACEIRGYQRTRLKTKEKTVS